MKKLLNITAFSVALIISGLSSSLVASAQDVNYTQYYLNLPGINPGFTGIEDYVDLKAGFRQGWNDFGVKNDNIMVSVYAPLGASKRLAIKKNAIRVSNVAAYDRAQSDKKIRRRSGLGGMLTSRNIGPYKASTVSLNYAYHLPISRTLALSMGAKVGYATQNINFNGYTVRDQVNDVFYNQLMSSNSGIKNSILMDFGATLYSDRFYFGLSSGNLVAKNVNGDQLWSINSQRQYNAQGGYIARLSPNYELNTAVRVSQADGYDINWAANARLRYKKFISFGAGYDQTSKLSFLFGLSARGNFSINYSYDHYMTNAGNLNVSVHEVIINLGLFNKYGSGPRLW